MGRGKWVYLKESPDGRPGWRYYWSQEEIDRVNKAYRAPRKPRKWLQEVFCEKCNVRTHGFNFTGNMYDLDPEHEYHVTCQNCGHVNIVKVHPGDYPHWEERVPPGTVFDPPLKLKETPKKRSVPLRDW